MKKRLFATRPALACMAFAATLASCVEDTYDLDKDIDTSVYVTIDHLSLPTSAIEPITLDKLLELEDYTDVDKVTAEDLQADQQKFVRMAVGDYYFLNSSDNSTKSHVNVKAITIDPTDHTGGTSQELKFIGGNQNFTNGRQLKTIVDLHTDVKLSANDVTDEIVKLNWADVEVPIDINIKFTGDNLPEKILLEKGVELAFDPYLTLVSNAQFDVDPSKPYIAKLKQDLPIRKNSLTTLHLAMTHVDCQKMDGKGDNLGLYKTGHFSMRPNVAVTGNAVLLESDFPLGLYEVTLKLKADISIGRISLKKVNGVFTPKNSYNIDPVKISDLPDFMTDEGTSIVLADPRVTFWAESQNMEGLDVVLNDIRVIPMQDGKPIERNIVTIKRIDFDTKKSVVNSLYLDNYTGTVTPSLSKLMDGVIPDEVTFEMGRIELTGTITLDNRYDILMDYEMMAPFSLDKGSRIHYEETMDGMNSDICDLYDEADVENLELTLDLHYINTVPINMTITEATPIDVRGNKIDGIVVELNNAAIKAGMQEKETEGSVHIVLKQPRGKKFDNFDGLRIAFEADVDEAHAKRTLNAAQKLHFDAVTVTVSGAVEVEV